MVNSLRRLALHRANDMLTVISESHEHDLVFFKTKYDSLTIIIQNIIHYSHNKHYVKRRGAKSRKRSFNHMSQHIKVDLMFFRLVALQMRVHSSLFKLQICVLCLKLSHGLYYLSANSKGSGDTARMHRLT